MKIDKEYYTNNKKYMDMRTIQTAVKCYNNLHAKGIYYVYRKYMFARDSMFRSIKAKHDTSNKVKLPYKKKKYFNTGWDYQSIKYDFEKGLIKLSRPISHDENGKKINNPPVKCYTKNIPQDIKEIELVYRNGLYLVIKYKEEDIQQLIQSNNSAAIDLGEIHSITSIDNNGHAIIITGRKLRSIKRLRDKEQGKLRSKMSKCKKHSKQYKTYRNALWNLKYKTERQIFDCVHKISKLYLDYCLENNISKVYYGDLDNCTRNSSEKIGKMVGQKLNEWNYGELTLQLRNKLERYGIEMIKVSEAYSSQTCPHCGKRHKPNSRNYDYRCGYHQHRDLVGAINILNFNEDIKQEYHTSFKYLRIE
ncbi:MAG: hypothetical protein K0R54_5456 [Clostridiaceae bacterium]|nr:hypothetical protein [Clostridiaceae bacterium]MDF2950508.1 hypothetical protein [Anaerocolumna sp.]